MDILGELGIPLSFGISATIIGLVLSFYAERRSRRNKELLEARRESLKKALLEAQGPLIDQLRGALSELPEDIRARYIQYLIYSQRPDGSFPEPPIIPSATATKEEIEELIEKRMSTLRTKVDEIENRFPSEATLEKIASVNDAILATNLENLAESVKRLEERLLSRWDVVKVVFQIIAALGALIGIIFAIIKYLA